MIAPTRLLCLLVLVPLVPTVALFAVLSFVPLAANAVSLAQWREGDHWYLNANVNQIGGNTNFSDKIRRLGVSPGTNVSSPLKSPVFFTGRGRAGMTPRTKVVVWASARAQTSRHS